jgi:hypothetical protein
LNSEITIHNIQEVFFRMEEAEGLFDLRTRDGTYFWDIVRRAVFACLHRMHGGPFVDEPPLPVPSLVTDTKDAVKALLNRISLHYLQARAPRYIFITGQRIRQINGLVDNISDHLYELVSEDAVAVELMNRGAINYRKILLGRKSRIPPVAVRRRSVEKDLSRVVEAISSVIGKYFGVSMDTYNLVFGPMLVFRENRDYYLALFARHRPNAVVCINNGTMYGLFSAGKEMGVPVVELQHGGSNYRTIYWSYPKSISATHPGLIVPTAYFTFADFWNENTHFPVRMTRSIGNDYFYQNPTVGDENGVLIISTYMHHEALFKLALELSDLAKEKVIYYKLHPHQFEERMAVMAARGGRSNIVIVCDEMDFPQLFRSCDYVVGVHSTALYIALQAGKRVCLYKRSIYFWHEEIFPYVEIFDGVAELRDILANPPGKYFQNRANQPMFFHKFDARKFMQALQDLE